MIVDHLPMVIAAADIYNQGSSRAEEMAVTQIRESIAQQIQV